MPKVVIIILMIQYLWGMFLRTTTSHIFGVPDLILHILFIVQTICVLFLIYMYIHWKNAQNLNEDTKSIVNTMVNIVILLAVIILSLNLVNVFFIDTLKDIFNIL